MTLIQTVPKVRARKLRWEVYTLDKLVGWLLGKDEIGCRGQVGFAQMEKHSLAVVGRW